MKKILFKENKSFNSHVGDIIKHRREKAGVTQQELGKALNLSRFSVSNIENGNQSLSFFQACVVAKYLNVPIDTFAVGFSLDSIFDSSEKERLSEEELESMKNALGALGFNKREVDE